MNPYSLIRDNFFGKKNKDLLEKAITVAQT